MEATCSSETLIDIQRTTPRYIPEARTVHNHRYENFKSYMLSVVILLLLFLFLFFFFFFFFLYGAAAHVGPWPPLYEVP
jgi:hypothetical protein